MTRFIGNQNRKIESIQRAEQFDSEWFVCAGGARRWWLAFCFLETFHYLRVLCSSRGIRDDEVLWGRGGCGQLGRLGATASCLPQKPHALEGEKIDQMCLGTTARHLLDLPKCNA
eukprot:c20704_g2_i5.p1 GENE.c20704_g2_i5~~c20704_g2_i5.p1  ORF type:complete len:115 (-),score=14.89 c20704_g2_i5:94-438(-)